MEGKKETAPTRLKTSMKALTLDEALEKNPVSFFQYRLLLLCGLAFMVDSLEVNLLTFISTCAGNEWDLTSQEQASITAIVFIGIIAGSMFWGIFADRYGRKMTFLLVCIIISVAGFASGAAPSYGWLVLLRAIAGFGIGGVSIPFDLLAEFLPPSHRGTFLIYLQYFWTIGSLFVSGVAWLSLSTYGWRFLTYVTAIPVTLTSIYSICYLPESPRWLLLKGRREEAEKIIKEAALINGVVMEPFVLKEFVFEDEHVEASYSDLLTIKEIRNITIPLWIVWFIFGITYYGVILFVGRIYAKNDHIAHDKSCSFDYPSIFINTCSEIFGVTISFLLVDKMGRRYTQSGFYVLGAFAVALMGLNLQGSLLILVAGIGRLSALAASNVTWVVTPELYSTNVRTVGHASCIAFSKLGSFISPFLVVSTLSYYQVGLILGTLNVFAALSALLLPETKDRDLDEHSNIHLVEHRELSRVNSSVSITDSFYHRNQILNNIFPRNPENTKMSSGGFYSRTQHQDIFMPEIEDDSMFISYDDFDESHFQLNPIIEGDDT